MKAEPKYEIDHSRTTYFTTVVNGEECTRKRVVLRLLEPPKPKIIVKTVKQKKPKKQTMFVPLFD